MGMNGIACCAVLLLLPGIVLAGEAPEKSIKGEGKEVAREVKVPRRVVDEFPLNERFKKHWPTADDLKWFREAKGMTGACALKIYGKPVKVVRQKDGAEAWHYPWVAVAIIYVKEGRVGGVWYDAGY